MRRFLLQLAVLAALLFGVNFLIGAGLPFAWGDARLDTKLHHWREHRDSYEGLALGSSWTYRHVAPRVLENSRASTPTGSPNGPGEPSLEEPLSIFNLAIDGAHLPYQARILEHLIEVEKARPRFVLLELARFTSAVDADLDHQREANFWRTAPMTASMIRFLAHRTDKSLPQKLYQAALLTLVQGEAWLHIGHGTGLLSQLAGNNRDPSVLGPDGDGFYAVDQQALEATGEPLHNRFLENPDAGEVLEEIRHSCQRAFEAPLQKPNPEGLRIVDNLLELTRHHDIHLIFLVPPRVCQRYAQIRPLLAHIPEAHRIDTLADPRQYPDLYRLEESADRTHFNALGAERYTRYLALEVRRKLATASQGTVGEID